MRKIIVIGICIIFCGFLTIFMITPFVNDAVAGKTAKELSKLPLPQNTEYIESVSKAGKLIGSGNGMQYFGAILIRSGLSLNELKEFYSKYEVKKQLGSEIEIIENARPAFKTEISEEEYYIVYSWGTNNGFFHEFDIRGH